MIRLGYMASNSFSGSTLLTLLLGAHREISTCGELKWSDLDLETYRCSCGELIRACPYWLGIQGALAEQGISFDLRNPRTEYRCGGTVSAKWSAATPRGTLFEAARNIVLGVSPEARREWQRFRVVNRLAIQTMLKADGATCFVDASKDPLRLRYLIDTGDYDLRIIHLVRDGRAVTYSAIKNEGSSSQRAAHEWVGTHHQIVQMARRLPKHAYMMIRYEDLCQNPERALNAICDFLSLSRMDLLDKYAQSTQHVLGNRMRLEARNGIKLDEKWRTLLKKEELEAFERIGGDLNRRYGYE